MKTPVSSILLVFIATIFGSFGAVFLKLGAEKLRYGLRHIISGQAAFGVTLFLCSSVFYGWGVKKGELSVLYPLSSLSYVWALIWSKFFFREVINAQKFVALGMILSGILLIAVGR